MSERENQEIILENFWKEIEQIRLRDKTMHAVKNVKKLDEQCLEYFERLKKIIDLGEGVADFDPKTLREIADEMFMPSVRSGENDIKEFYAWMKNVMTTLASLKNFDASEVGDVINSIKQRIHG